MNKEVKNIFLKLFGRVEIKGIFYSKNCLPPPIRVLDSMRMRRRDNLSRLLENEVVEVCLEESEGVAESSGQASFWQVG